MGPISLCLYAMQPRQPRFNIRQTGKNVNVHSQTEIPSINPGSDLEEEFDSGLFTVQLTLIAEWTGEWETPVFTPAACGQRSDGAVLHQTNGFAITL